MYIVRLNQLKYHAYHGLFSQEAKTGNDFEVDVEVSFEKKLKEKNSLKNIVDYSVLKDIIDTYMNQRFELLEDLLYKIVSDIEMIYPTSKGEVSIKKMQPPFGGRCDSSQVILKF